MCRCYICNKKIQVRQGKEEICNKCKRSSKLTFGVHDKEYEHSQLERPTNNSENALTMDGSGYYFDWHN